MSLSLTLSNALSGLQANARQADQISGNVANALTEGYSRRSVLLAENVVAGLGAGVSVSGVQRASSPAAAEARRLADAAAGRAGVLSDAAGRLATSVGDPGDAGALATAATRLQEAIAAAADTPESAALLRGAAFAADDFAQSINRIATEVATLRTEADAAIARQVADINGALFRIKSLNREIQSRAVTGGDISALQDQRERMIREVSGQIPIRVVRRENEAVAIYAKNGGQLLDGRVYELEFTPTRVVGPNQTLANGALSGLSIDGRAYDIGEGDGAGLFDGGALAAAFELRDRILPATGDDLDALAEDVILRTQGLAGDPTLGPGDAGLFTDEGVAYNPADRLGLALRISVNDQVNPDVGGDAFRMRDGVAAAAPGEVGESSVLRALQDAFAEAVSAPTGSRLTGDRSTAGFAAEISSFALTEAAIADEGAVFEAGRATALADAEQQLIGVDTDQELSQLLVVEQAFAANARVIRVVDELLETLTSI